MVFQLLGGIGLFLLGMMLLTDGLKAWAGDRLRLALLRFTGTPIKAFVSGALATVTVQSSSATTVAVIGFVSAGLLTFPQAVGVVFGASLGTTGTGWIVSVLGLNVSIGYYALPLVGIGAFVRLLGSGPKRSLGLALAGFGVIFIGISVLQEGMQGLSGVFSLGALPSTGIFGYFVVMLVGTLMTVVMQSSSAAVATTLTALHAQAINFDQAASLVIGAAIGTTVTGALAAIGGSVPAKRTALAHVLFNLATGLIAIVLLPLLLGLITLAQRYLGLDPGAVSLAAFHTVFIAIGVVLFLPSAARFARWIERRLPDRGPAPTRHLDDTVLAMPAIALEASRRALRETACEMFRALRQNLEHPETGVDEATRALIAQALDQTQQFFARIPAETEGAPFGGARVAQLHAIDHLLRLRSRLNVPPGIRGVLGASGLEAAARRAREMLLLAEDGLQGRASADWLVGMQEHAAALEQLRREERPAVIRQTADGRRQPAAALEVLDAIRWLERVVHHTWRVCSYLGREDRAEQAEHLPEIDFGNALPPAG